MQNKRKLALVVAIVLTLGLIGAGVFAYYRSQGQRPGGIMSSSQMKQQEEDMAAVRDNIRRQYAVTFASQLVRKVLVQKQGLSYTQKDAALIMEDDAGRPVLDPLTNQPYEFSLAQNYMQPGQMTFRVGGTCDDKTSESTGEGIIITARRTSVAVALKLESEGFACESNL